MMVVTEERPSVPLNSCTRTTLLMRLVQFTELEDTTTVKNVHQFNSAETATQVDPALSLMNIKFITSTHSDQSKESRPCSKKSTKEDLLLVVLLSQMLLRHILEESSMTLPEIWTLFMIFQWLDLE
jgi:hypothetical protein